MYCNEIRRHWHLYHDSEGDLELYWQINEHLCNCPSCVDWFDKQIRFHELLGRKLAVSSPDDALWSAVLHRTGLVRAR